MLYNLGGFKFDITMLNSFDLQSEFGISSNERISNTPMFFRANLGKTSLELNCKTLPFAKHANSALKPLYELATKALPYALVSGTGRYVGKFVITKINENRAIFDNAGRFFTQNFTLTLERVDDI